MFIFLLITNITFSIKRQAYSVFQAIPKQQNVLQE